MRLFCQVASRWVGRLKQNIFFFLAIMLSTSIRWRLRSMSEGRQNSCSDNRLTGNQTETGANLMERWYSDATSHLRTSRAGPPTSEDFLFINQLSWVTYNQMTTQRLRYTLHVLYKYKLYVMCSVPDTVKNHSNINNHCSIVHTKHAQHNKNCTHRVKWRQSILLSRYSLHVVGHNVVPCEVKLSKSVTLFK